LRGDKKEIRRPGRVLAPPIGSRPWANIHTPGEPNRFAKFFSKRVPESVSTIHRRDAQTGSNNGVWINGPLGVAVEARHQNRDLAGTKREALALTGIPGNNDGIRFVTAVTHGSTITQLLGPACSKDNSRTSTRTRPTVRSTVTRSGRQPRVARVPRFTFHGHRRQGRIGVGGVFQTVPPLDSHSMNDTRFGRLRQGHRVRPGGLTVVRRYNSVELDLRKRRPPIGDVVDNAAERCNLGGRSLGCQARCRFHLAATKRGTSLPGTLAGDRLPRAVSLAKDLDISNPQDFRKPAADRTDLAPRVTLATRSPISPVDRDRRPSSGLVIASRGGVHDRFTGSETIGDVLISIKTASGADVRASTR